MDVGLYAKAIIAAGVGALTVAITALQDGIVEPGEWVTIALAFFVGLGAVAVVRNAQSGPLMYAKAGVAAVVAGLGAVSAGIVDGGWPLSGNEWITVVLAVLAALAATYTTPNAVASDQFSLNANEV